MDSLVPYLLQHFLLTGDEAYHLCNMMYSPGEKAQMLIGFLKRKGDESLQRVLCCLNLAHEHMGHKTVADRLKQVMQANGVECADFCSDCRR